MRAVIVNDCVPTRVVSCVKISTVELSIVRNSGTVFVPVTVTVYESTLKHRDGVTETIGSGRLRVFQDETS